jgi:hypothetical protein
LRAARRGFTSPCRERSPRERRVRVRCADHVRVRHGKASGRSPVYIRPCSDATATVTYPGIPSGLQLASTDTVRRHASPSPGEYADLSLQER